MPLDPSLSLDLTPINQTQGGGLASSLGLVGQFAQIQNSLNQNKMFNQTFAARQKAGQIIAASPDLNTAFQNLTQDPEVAPFAGTIINEYRQGMLAQTQQQGEQQTQAQNGLQAVLKSIPGAVSSPSMLGALVTSQLGALSPQARARVEPAANAVVQSLTDGLDKLPQDQAMAEYRKRIAGIATSVGIGSDQFAVAAGKPTVVDQGNVQQPGLVSSTSGAITPAGNAFGIGAPAGYKDVNGVPVGVPAIGAGGAPTQGQAPPPALANAELARINAAVPGNALGVSPPTGQSPSTGIAGDGNPLIPTGTKMAGSPSASAPQGVAGMPLLSDAQKRLSNDLAAQYGDEDKKTFQGAQGTLGQLQFMDHALDQMASTGGIMVPGTWADARTSLAKAALTVAQMVGSKDLPFDPTTVASVESFNKATAQMGTMLTTSLLGQQREAAQTITRLTSAVPGISNTFMGGKLVSAGIQATMQRIIDQRNFQNAWLLDPANKGDLAGSAEAFNSAHPAQGYAQGVLDKFGMTAKGFASPQDVATAVAKGFLTKEQAKPILQQQFGMQ